MAVKMKIEKDKKLVCTSCNIKWENTPEMYTIGINQDGYNYTNYITLCKDCLDVLFKKTLKASCNYNGRVKQKEDMERIKRNHIWKERKNEEEKAK